MNIKLSDLAIFLWQQAKGNEALWLCGLSSLVQEHMSEMADPVVGDSQIYTTELRGEGLKSQKADAFIMLKYLA